MHEMIHEQIHVLSLLHRVRCAVGGATTMRHVVPFRQIRRLFS